MAFQTATKAVLLVSALLYTQPAGAQDLKEELDCLARNIYFESRNQPLAGRLAVGQVTMNRVDSPRFPNTVCDVVMQGGERLHRCQFSWYCDGEVDFPSDEIRFREAADLASTNVKIEPDHPNIGPMCQIFKKEMQAENPRELTGD